VTLSSLAHKYRRFIRIFCLLLQSRR